MSFDAIAIWIGHGVMATTGLAALGLAIALLFDWWGRRVWHRLTLAYDLGQLREIVDQLRRDGRLKNRRLQRDETVD